MLPTERNAVHTSKGFVRLTEGMGTARGSGLAGGTAVLPAGAAPKVFERLLAADEEVLVGGA
jgi:hypothetical protein